MQRMTSPPEPAPPIRFCFGLHVHQPVGNFGYVFEQHVRDVYLPFLERLDTHGFFPVSLHISGPLIEWLEAHDRRYLDLVARLAAAGKVELLAAGFYEPILAAVPRPDRVEQVHWLQESLHRLCGVRAEGLWLTERVWEPDLAADLHDAGITFALVDDRHFLTSGFSRDQLHRPWRTEHNGKGVALFPIDERLRYLIPFRPPAETAEYLRSRRAAGHQLAVLADDGEKFGGWPGTHTWVYAEGWLDRFLSTMAVCVEEGEVVLSTFRDALTHVPGGGLAYLGTASYREMEGWSLPEPAAVRLSALERTLGAARVAADGEFLRGSHWRNFLVKYAEANRMHKKMVALSALARERGDPPTARRAIARAQCNDAYWHGVFGGLYLPFLRGAVWGNLAQAEGVLRAAEELTVEVIDIDACGEPEVWVHSSAFSAIVAPHRGGALEELTHFANEENLADALTRRREAYHHPQDGDAGAVPSGETTGEVTAADPDAGGETSHPGATSASAGHEAGHAAAPSIHDIEKQAVLAELPPVDDDLRAIFLDRTVAASCTMVAFQAGAPPVVRSWARSRFSVAISRGDDGRVQVTMQAPDGQLTKTLTFTALGAVSVQWRWDENTAEPGAYFTSELSLTRSIPAEATPAADRWEYPIETVAKSEKGFDRTLQGTAVVFRWPIALGAASLVLPVPTRRVWD